jgi:hypothetical protein
MQRVGIVAFGVSLLFAVAVVTRFVLGNGWAAAAFVTTLAMFVAFWLAVPLVGRDSMMSPSEEAVEGAADPTGDGAP